MRGSHFTTHPLLSQSHTESGFIRPQVKAGATAPCVPTAHFGTKLLVMVVDLWWIPRVSIPVTAKVGSLLWLKKV